MVGADPNNCSGSGCSVTLEADITPLIVNIDGLTFSGNNVLDATLASPQFALNDYGTTPAATAAGAFPNLPAFIRGPGGTLSQGDAGIPLQLQDATMRAQFNKTGSSNYHVKLHYNVLPAVTINVPNNQGVLLQSGRGVIFADVNISWWASQIKNLETTADPTHLPIYLTNNVLLHIGKDVFNCCVIGFHGAGARGGGSTNSNGNAKVQTFAWASWVQPGIMHGRTAARTGAQDIHALSHESPNGLTTRSGSSVDPWQTPTALQRVQRDPRTGDPVVGSVRHRPNVRAGPNPSSQSADGYYHPEDESFPVYALAPATVRADAEPVYEHRSLHAHG
jgi:hypothetical protein